MILLRCFTQELYRSLSVTGLLLTAGTGKKPVLRTADLDVVAERVSRVERQAKPIQVAGRSASYRQRNFLMPKLKNWDLPAGILNLSFMIVLSCSVIIHPEAQVGRIEFFETPEGES